MRGARGRISRSLRRVAPGGVVALAILASSAGPASASSTICKDDPVPTGEVVISTTLVFGCTQVNNIQWTIDFPSPSGSSACSVTPTIPQDFVITKRDSNYAGCNEGVAGGGSGPGMTLRIPGGTGPVPVCQGSREPSDWVRIASGSSYMNCGPNGGYDFGYTIRQPNPSPGTQTPVCEGSNPPPGGFVVVARGKTYSACLPDQLGFTIEVPVSGQITTVCEGSPVPTGFVIRSGLQPKSQCDGGNGFDIGPAINGGVMCDPNPPPDWVITAIANRTECGGLGYTIAQPNGNGVETTACNLGAPLPIGFVIVRRNDTDPVCSGAPVIVIRTPTASGTDVCDISPVPTDYVITATSNSYAGCGSTGGPGGGKHILQPNPNVDTPVCDGSVVPGGFAVVAIDPSYPSCLPSQSGFTIGPARNGSVVCDPNALPPQFVINAIASSIQCQGLGYTVVQPNQDGSTTLACDPSQPPTDFVVVARDLTVGACNGGLGRTIRTAGGASTLNVCLESGIPNGFVVTAYGASYPGCGDDGGNGPGESLQLFSGQAIVACEPTPIPSGLVVTAIGTASQCQQPYSTGTTYTIQQPGSIQQVICDVGAPVPDGYEVVTSGNYSQCGGGAGFTIQPIGAPQPFVNPEPDVTGPPAPVPPLCPQPPGSGIATTATRNTAVCP